jgi:hypothetical protein
MQLGAAENASVMRGWCLPLMNHTAEEAFARIGGGTNEQRIGGPCVPTIDLGQRGRSVDGEADLILIIDRMLAHPG